MKTEMINNTLIKSVLNIDIDRTIEGATLGLIDNTVSHSTLTFMDNKKYANNINNNSNVSYVFTTRDNLPLLSERLTSIITDDPRWAFYKLLDHLARTIQYPPSNIPTSVRAHQSATISEVGVNIADGTVIEPNVTVMPGVDIGRNCIIRAGAVIGGDGFEHKRTSKGILSVSHDGKVIIGDRVEIGVNNQIAKGFSYRETRIAQDSKLDALVHVAHGVQIGESCLVAANAMIAGSVSIGDNVWIGPSASLSNGLFINNNAFITLGSVVVRDVGEGEKVSGNFAIPHRKFLKHLKYLSK